MQTVLHAKTIVKDAAPGGINVVFTPGRYNAAYFEHSYLAEKTGAVLAECGDLYVENNCVYLKTVHGGERVGAIYRLQSLRGLVLWGYFTCMVMVRSRPGSRG